MPRQSRGLLANYYSIATGQYRLHRVRLHYSRFHHYLPVANYTGEVVSAISLAGGCYGLQDDGARSKLALKSTRYSNENPCSTSYALHHAPRVVCCTRRAPSH